MTVLVDSWAWIEYFQGSEAGKKIKSHVEGSERIIISTINVAEVFRQIMVKRSREEAESAVDYMLKASFPVPVSVAIAINAALIRHEKKWGLGDSIVFATAKQCSAVVLTGDPDFKNQEGVIFIS